MVRGGCNNDNNNHEEVTKSRKGMSKLETCTALHIHGYQEGNRHEHSTNSTQLFF